MTPELSEPITRQQEPQLSEWALALMGRRVVGIRYRSAPGSSWPDGNSSAGIHEVDMSVVLVLDGDNEAVISWAMDGLVEGLGLRFRTSAEASAPRSDEIEVTTTAEWRPLVGQTVHAVAAAWHVPNEGCPDTLWAVRLSLSGESSIAVALGEIEDDIVQYQPDALVVLFDEASARAYKPPASAESAFGTALTL